MSHPDQSLINAYNHPGVGLRNVGSYQISGHPYLTGSNIDSDATLRIEFPYITKRVNIQVTGSQPCLLTFVHMNTHTTPGWDAGKNNFWTIWPTVSGSSNGHSATPNSWGAQNKLTMDVKVKELYLTAQYGDTGVQVAAELTGIPTNRMYALTGSGVVSTD